jgi:hypothetical protein
LDFTNLSLTMVMYAQVKTSDPSEIDPNDV